MRNGWIKLHREIGRKAIWKCSGPQRKSVLISLLLMANFEENQWVWKGKKYHCQPGEFITSLRSISDFSGVGIQSVRSALDKFKNVFDFLNYESTRENTKVTILNWYKYQLGEDEANTPSDTPTDTPSDTPVDTRPTRIKKDKKEKKQEKTFCPNSDEFRLANGLFMLMKNNNPKVKEPNLQVWAGHIDKMIRIDKRTFEEIEVRIRWSQKNAFWLKNIRSTEKLRNQFDRLTDEMKSEKKTNQYGKVDPKPIGEAYRDKTYEEFLEISGDPEDAKWQLELQEKRNAIRT